jgi:hypothetical protein
LKWEVLLACGRAVVLLPPTCAPVCTHWCVALCAHPRPPALPAAWAASARPHALREHACVSVPSRACACVSDTVRLQGPEVPVVLRGSLNKNPAGLLWESPMLSADLKGRFIQEVTVRANDGFNPAMSCLLGCVLCCVGVLLGPRVARDAGRS